MINMFLHIGNHIFIREKKIIGIFDTDNATVSGTTRKFLAEQERKGLINAAKKKVIPKSFILYETENTGKEKNYKIYFSQISSSALVGRSEQEIIYVNSVKKKNGMQKDRET